MPGCHWDYEHCDLFPSTTLVESVRTEVQSVLIRAGLHEVNFPRDVEFNPASGWNERATSHDDFSHLPDASLRIRMNNRDLDWTSQSGLCEPILSAQPRSLNHHGLGMFDNWTSCIPWGEGDRDDDCWRRYIGKTIEMHQELKLPSLTIQHFLKIGLASIGIITSAQVF